MFQGINSKTKQYGLNPVISPEAQVGKIFKVNVVKAFNRQKLELTHKEDLLEQKYFTGSMPFLTHNHCFNICGSPKALIHTTTFKKYSLKSRLEGRNVTS